MVELLLMKMESPKLEKHQILWNSDWFISASCDGYEYWFRFGQRFCGVHFNVAETEKAARWTMEPPHNDTRGEVY